MFTNALASCLFKTTIQFFIRMKRFFFLFSVIVFLGTVTFCCSSPHKKLFKQLAAQKDKSKYPNPDSELALLMRAMDKDMQAIKQAIISDKRLPYVYKRFKAIRVAQPTDASVKTPQFTNIANLLLSNTKKLYNAKETSKTYNLLVNNCMACHQSYCPGPIVRIKKLRIPE